MSTSRRTEKKKPAASSQRAQPARLVSRPAKTLTPARPKAAPTRISGPTTISAAKAARPSPKLPVPSLVKGPNGKLNLPSVDQRALAAALAQRAAPRVHKALKEKKKDGGFKKFVKGAARTALELAPAILPFLLGPQGHPATQAAVRASGAPEAQMVGLATAATLQPFAHVSGFKASDRHGRNFSMSFTGLEYIGDVANGELYTGDLLTSFTLNPTDPRFSGTKLALYALMYEQYSLEKCCVIYQPTCAATVSGAVCHYIDIDPDDKVDTENSSPFSRIQKASQHDGFDTSQVWQTCMCEREADGRQPPFFCDADGSDARLISAGTYNLLCASDITTIADGGPASVGSLYVAYRVTFSVPQMDNSIDTNGMGMTTVGTATTTNDGSGLNMFGLADPFGTGNYTPAANPVGPLSTYFPCQYAPTGSYWQAKLDAEAPGGCTSCTYFRCLALGTYFVVITSDNNKHNTPIAWWSPSDYGVTIAAVPYTAWVSPNWVNADATQTGSCMQDLDSYGYGYGRCCTMFILTVTETWSGDDQTGSFFATTVCNDTSVSADCSTSLTLFKIADVPDSTDLSRMTLQDYEKKVGEQQERIDRLERFLEVVPPSPITAGKSPADRAAAVRAEAKKDLISIARAKAKAAATPALPPLSLRKDKEPHPTSPLRPTAPASSLSSMSAGAPAH